MINLSDWKTLWLDLKGQTNPETSYNALCDLYTESHRAYHNLNHIEDCLTQFAEVKHLAEQPNEVEAALWLHDVIYDPRASDNEAQSKDWAVDILTQGKVTKTSIETISILILDTQHTVIPQTLDGKLIVDIDLSILGRPPKVFEKYEQQIRGEYQWVPIEHYRLGRRQILQSFLERDQIYQTAFFQERFEIQARKNLQTSIDQLTP
ncbi:MAG: N-methyl-D-aspartate receptor NMDAR2C subunit [Chloroflexota bacterium]